MLGCGKMATRFAPIDGYCPGCKKRVRWWQQSLIDDIQLVSQKWHIGCFLLIIYHVLEDNTSDARTRLMHLERLAGVDPLPVASVK